MFPATVPALQVRMMEAALGPLRQMLGYLIEYGKRCPIALFSALRSGARTSLPTLPRQDVDRSTICRRSTSPDSMRQKFSAGSLENWDRASASSEARRRIRAARELVH